MARLINSSFCAVLKRIVLQAVARTDLYDFDLRHTEPLEKSLLAN
jgi:hypothetical protein